jgi:hypothetical protein
VSRLALALRRTRTCYDTLAATRSPTKAMTRGRCKRTSDIATSSTRSGTRSCRLPVSRIFGDDSGVGQFFHGSRGQFDLPSRVPWFSHSAQSLPCTPLRLPHAGRGCSFHSGATLRVVMFRLRAAMPRQMLSEVGSGRARLSRLPVLSSRMKEAAK